MSASIVRAFALIVLTIGGCAPPAMTPQQLADATTRAVFDGDAGRTRAHFDERLRAIVTPHSVAAISHVMHRYGAYRNLTALAQVVAERRYFYEAQFERGSMLVQMRLARDGRSIAGYHVKPNEPR